MKNRTMLQPGDIVNDLTILAEDHKDKRHRRFLLCRCVCGREKVIQGSLITSGNTKSCGCLFKKVRAATALPGSLGAMRQVILQNYKRQGEHYWELTEQEYYGISQKDCYYCGAPPSQVKRGQGNGLDFVYNGLDRVDSSKHYVAGNVVPCCKICNVAKNNMTTQEFYDWVKRINAMAKQWGNY